MTMTRKAPHDITTHDLIFFEPDAFLVTKPALRLNTTNGPCIAVYVATLDHPILFRATDTVPVLTD